MKKTLAVLLLSLMALSAIAARRLPEGWFLAGNRPRDYERGARGGEQWLASKEGRTPEGFGTIMRTVAAKPYRGKRMRMTASVRTLNVAQWAGVWMRVDGSRHKMLAFDNMRARPIRGTSDWHDYTIVLDVPQDSEELSFGILLAGPGKVWIDNVRFANAANVPVTSPSSPNAPPPVKLKRK